jgi:DNA polymerase/3'-5' exonuclease PolX
MSIMQITQTVQIMPPLQVKHSKRTTQPMLPGLELESEAPPKITNRQIAEVLASIADIIAAQNGNPYRIQAYRNAARGILDLQESAVEILARGEALPVPGLGQRLRGRITELIQIGSMTINMGFYLQTLPPGVRALLALDFIGPYTAIRLHEELGIDSAEKLSQEARQHHIRQLPGFGTRSEARLQASAERAMHRPQKNQTTSLGGVA